MDRHRRVSLYVTTLIATLTIAAPAAHAADCPGANLLPALASVPAAQDATLCLLNGERAANGLAPLTAEGTLQSAATSYAQTMVQQRFFAHVTPSGQTLKERLSSYFSAGGVKTGENLGWGAGPLATPGAMVKSWMVSPSHRANVLNSDFQQVGVGIANGSPTGLAPAAAATYTAAFGAPGASASGSSATRASASSAAPVTVRTTSTKRVSAKRKAQISKRCNRIAKRTKASKKTRKARYNRCMRKELRAAKR